MNGYRPAKSLAWMVASAIIASELPRCQRGFTLLWATNSASFTHRGHIPLTLRSGMSAEQYWPFAPALHSSSSVLWKWPHSKKLQYCLHMFARVLIVFREGAGAAGIVSLHVRPSSLSEESQHRLTMLSIVSSLCTQYLLLQSIPFQYQCHKGIYSFPFWHARHACLASKKAYIVITRHNVLSSKALVGLHRPLPRWSLNRSEVSDYSSGQEVSGRESSVLPIKLSRYFLNLTSSHFGLLSSQVSQWKPSSIPSFSINVALHSESL